MFLDGKSDKEFVASNHTKADELVLDSLRMKEPELQITVEPVCNLELLSFRLPAI
jgi:hypothetical protein